MAHKPKNKAIALIVLACLSTVVWLINPKTRSGGNKRAYNRAREEMVRS